MTNDAERRTMNADDTRHDEIDAGVDPRLLEILICPLTRGPLTYDREANELVSRQAGLAYPIRNGVPIMLRDEARDLTAAK
jgi:uncharacterized protein YbaR (Trm112 family)